MPLVRHCEVPSTAFQQASSMQPWSWQVLCDFHSAHYDAASSGDQPAAQPWAVQRITMQTAAVPSQQLSLAQCRSPASTTILGRLSICDAVRVSGASKCSQQQLAASSSAFASAGSLLLQVLRGALVLVLMLVCQAHASAARSSWQPAAQPCPVQ
eukprot:2930830-Amphidinium_carterae.1